MIIEDIRISFMFNGLEYLLLKERGLLNKSLKVDESLEICVMKNRDHRRSKFVCD